MSELNQLHPSYIGHHKTASVIKKSKIKHQLIILNLPATKVTHIEILPQETFSAGTHISLDKFSSAFHYDLERHSNLLGEFCLQDLSWQYNHI